MPATEPARLALEEIFAPLSRVEFLALLRERKLTYCATGPGAASRPTQVGKPSRR